MSMDPYRMAPTVLVELKKQIVVEETIYSAQHFTLGSASVVGKEEGWEFASVCGLQATE